MVLLCWAQASAETIRIESPANQATLVELYTSEGCSSCPPADRWLSRLKTHPRLWNDLVPVAFHVDYWNYLGWEDRFAEPDYSQRQRDYACYGSVRTVYTPGFVVNGEEWRGWFSRPSLGTASPRTTGHIVAQIDRGKLQVEFHPEANDTHPLQLHVALLGFELETPVKRGENRGRLLKHDFVVLGHAQHPFKLHGSHYQLKTELPRTSELAPRQALAVWVTRSNDPRPIQAAGGWLN